MSPKKETNQLFDQIHTQLLQEKNDSFNRLEQFENDVSDFSQALNSLSDKIRSIESILRKYNVNIPFRLPVDKKRYAKKKPKQEHLDDVPDFHYALYYWPYEEWILSWDTYADNSKEFRLLLISEESEIVKREQPSGYYDVSYFMGQIFMKPFIECKLELRLKYFCYLDEFINGFRQYLKDFQDQIGEAPLQKYFE